MQSGHVLVSVEHFGRGRMANKVKDLHAKISEQFYNPT